MSRAVQKNGDKQSEKLINLMIEYAGRLQTLMEKAEKSTEAKASLTPRIYGEKLDLLEHHLTYLSPAVDDLSRHVSQLIEHGNVDDLTRLEFRLRLADLEHAKIATKRLLRIATRAG